MNTEHIFTKIPKMTDRELWLFVFIKFLYFLFFLVRNIDHIT
jgi:hypothetical protein